MQRLKVMRAIAAASVLAMTLTSMPVMAAEVNEIGILDDGNDDFLTLGDEFEEEITSGEEFVTDEEIADESSLAAFNNEESLESGIIDTQKPEAIEAWFGSSDKKVKSISVGHSDKFDMSILTKDDLSGVTSAYISFADSSNNSFNINFSDSYYYGEDGKKYYYKKGEFHSSEISVPSDAVPGTYKIYAVGVYDNAGNNNYYSKYVEKEIPAAFEEVQITITDKPSEVGAVVSEFSISPTVVNGGDKISAKGKVNTKGELPSDFDAYFINKESGKQIAMRLSNNDGAYIGEKEISEYAVTGKYVLNYISIYAGGKSRYQYAKGNEMYGKEGYEKVPDSIAELSFTVQNTKTDKEAPVLKNIKFDNTTVNVPGRFVATVDATDNRSGVDSVGYIAFSSTSGSFECYESYNPESNKLSLNVSQYQKSCKVQISRIELWDKAGNSVIYYADEKMAKEKGGQVLPDSIKKIVLTVKNDDESASGTAVSATTSTILDSLVNDINSAADGSSIHVDYSGNNVLPKSALNAIKGKNKTLLLNEDNIQYELNGKNVTDASKDWNMGAVFCYFSSGNWSEKVFGTKADELPGIRFEELGALPGKAKIRIMFNYNRDEGLIGSNSICAYAVEMKGTDYTQTISLSNVAGPMKFTGDGNLEFEISSRPEYIVFAPAPAKTTSITVNKYSVVDKFKDVENKWYAPYIQEAIDKGYMKGTGDTTFAPDAECTRAMMVQILYNAKGAKGGGKTPFKDAQSGWFTDAVGWAYNNKVTAGISATEFGTNASVTREQVAQFLYNYAAMCGYNVTDAADLSKYFDAADVSGWALKGMKWANAKQIVNGTDAKKLLPKKTATRAEVATMIVNYMRKIEKR